MKVGDVVATATTADGKSYTINLPASADALEVGKTYPVSVNGLRDLAGNFASNPTTFNVTVTRDDVKPTFTLNAVNPTQFDIVFSEEMTNSVPADAIVVRNSDDAVLAQSGLAVRQTDKKTFRVTLATTPIASDKTSAELSVSVKSLTDVAGNAVSAKTEKVTLSKETVKPEMKSIRLLPATNNQLEVTFSEPVSGIATGDFALTDSEGNSVSITAVSASTTDAQNKVILTINSTTGLTKNDTYKLANIVDSVVDTSGNKNAAKVLTFTYNGATALPVTATFDADYDGASTPAVLSSTAVDRKILVKFDRADIVNGIDATTGNYKAGAADNLSNYTLNGVALPEGTTITFNDASSVTSGVGDTAIIDLSAVAASKLPIALKEGGKVVVTASNVKTSAGSTIPYASAELTVKDTSSPRMTAAYLEGNRTGGTLKLTVQFSEEVVLPGTLSTANNDLVLVGLQSDGTSAAVVSLAAVGYAGTDKTKVVFNVSSANIDVTKAVKLHTAATADIDLKDGETNKLSAVVLADALNVSVYATN